MAPAEIWSKWFGEIEPAEFWRRSHEEAPCQHADEAVDCALCGYPPFFYEYEEHASWEERESLSEYLARCVPGVPLDDSGQMVFP